MTIDIERLRSDLKDEYGSAMCAGFDFAMMDMIDVERASHAELVEMARKKRWDLRKYEM